MKVYNLTTREFFPSIRSAVNKYRGSTGYYSYHRSLRHSARMGDACEKGYRWSYLEAEGDLPEAGEGEISFITPMQKRIAPLPGILLCKERNRAYLSHREAEIEFGLPGLEALLPFPPGEEVWAGHTWSYIPFHDVPIFPREERELLPQEEEREAPIEEIEVAAEAMVDVVPIPESPPSLGDRFDYRYARPPKSTHKGNQGNPVRVRRHDTGEIYETITSAVRAVGRGSSAGTLSRKLKEGNGKCPCWGIEWSILL